MNGEEWREEAVCQSTDPEIFFPDKGSESRTAVKVCRTCPVKQPCLEYALTIPLILGEGDGTTEQDRRRMRRRAA